MDTRTTATTAYAERQFVREPAAWASARAKGDELRSGMQMGCYEGALLNWLAHMHQPKRILEIGTFMGLTALWMAQALPKDGKLITLERDANYAKLARKHTEHEPRIEVIETDALAWLRDYKDAPFDMLFIDAEKRSYYDYLVAALPRLTKNALIVADNTLLFGAMLGEAPQNASKEAIDAMTRFHDELADKGKYTSMLLPTVEGLTVALRK